MNSFIFYCQRVLEVWMDFQMLHAEFYQAFSCQACWLILDIVKIELNDPGNGHFAASWSRVRKR